MLSSWDLWILLSRVGVYAGVAGSLGASFALLAFHHPESRHRLVSYLRWSAAVGILAVISNFIARCAAMGGSFASAFDEVFLSILWQSGAGSSSRWQLAGFTAAIMGSLLLRKSRLHGLGIALLSSGLLAVLWSFTFVGHLATHSWYDKLALALHVLAMSLWLGSLYPLATLLKDAQGEDNLKRFSSVAPWIVGLLGICGLWMALALLDSGAQLLSTGYGRILLIKLGLLAVLLSLAAANKWILVPDYNLRPNALRRSIQGEILLALCILMLTAVLANLVSPH